MQHTRIHNERISRSAADKLFQTLQDRNCSYSTLSYEARMEELDRYRAEKQGLATPYYDELPELLPRFGLSFRAFFELLGIPCHWADENAPKLAEELAALSEADQMCLYRITQSLLPEVWSQANWNGSPSRRMHLWRFNVTDAETRLRIRREYQEQFPRFFAESSGRGRVDTEDLWALGDLYGIPYHFLLGEPPVAILAANPRIEAIMTDYLRLPASSRRIVEHLIHNAADLSWRTM